MLARFAAAGDKDAQANLLPPSPAPPSWLAARTAALDYMRAREALLPGTDSFRSRNSSLSLPAMFELAASGPAAARAELDRARRLAADGQAEWVDPFLGFAAGGIAFTAGDWDDAVAELDAALEQAEETGTGWISLPVGIRAYIDAHRGGTGPARARLDPSGAAACRSSSATTVRAGPNWPCWKPRESIRRGRHAGPDACGPPPGTIPAGGSPIWPPT